MRYVLGLAAAVLLAVPAHISAQLPTPEPPYRITIAPVVGYAFTGDVGGRLVMGRSGTIDSGDFEYALGGGPVSGLSGDYKVLPRLHVTAMALYQDRGTTEVRTVLNGDLLVRAAPGSKMFVGRAGVRWELLDPDHDMQIYRPRAYVLLGPALIHERQTIDYVTGSKRTFMHPAVFLGVDAELATPARHWTVRVGLDDTFVLWSEGSIERSFNREYSAEFNEPVTTVVEARNSHTFMVKAALAYHF